MISCFRKAPETEKALQGEGKQMVSHQYASVGETLMYSTAQTFRRKSCIYMA